MKNLINKIKSFFFRTPTLPTQDNPALRVKPLILIIEDEGLLNRMYAKKMEMDGFEYVTASNGDEGIKLALDKRPDLIICDVMMPVKDGITVLKELKIHQVTREIPVVMLSNLADEKYVNEALEIGAVSYLIKSELLPSDVITKIKEVLASFGKKSLLTRNAA
jgi:DNA-binding response OmpR family regulator